MLNLLQIEWLKIKSYKAFWILGGIYLASLAFGTIALIEFIDSVSNTSLGLIVYKFPNIWFFMCWFAGFMHYIAATLIIVLVSNEFAFRTNRQGVINGQTRLQFLLSKFFLIVALAFVSMIVVITVTMIMGITHSKAHEIGTILEKIGFVFGYFIQSIGYLSVAMFISVLVKRSGISIGIFFSYVWIIEKILIWALPEVLESFLPIEVFNSMVELNFEGSFMDAVLDFNPPLPPLEMVGLAIVYIFLFAGGSFMLLKQRDL